jgi:predicted dehydrogenase/FAD/FMN-containing dehydrogenase
MGANMTNCVGRKPRIAVVGCSWFARAAHLPALQRLSDEGLVEIAALCSRTHESLSNAQMLLNRNAPKYTSIDEMFANEEIDLVDLVLPTPIIGSAILKSLRAGKNVISEKPCSATVNDCDELINYHSKNNPELSWSVAENWPFKPSVIATKELIDKKIIGKLENIDFVYRSRGWGDGNNGWRTNQSFKGGYLLDSGVHFVSMLRHITGGVKEVVASVGWHKSAHVADRVFSKVVYENNIVGNFIVDFTMDARSDEPFHLIIKGSNGSLRVNFINCQVLIENDSGNQIIQIPHDPWCEGGVYSMLRHCCESLTNGESTRCTPIEGLRDVAVIEAMLQSSRIGASVMPALFHKQLNGCTKQIKTYGNLNISQPRHLVFAKSIADVQTAVREAAMQGYKVRAVGTGNNWTNYSTNTEVAIETSAIDRLLSVDKARKTVRVSAGVHMRDVTNLLATHNLSLPSLPFLPDATVGGMVATATHGTSPHWGTVSDSVLAMNLITSSGELIEIDEDSESDLMKSARVSLGMLGVITEVELQVVDIKWVKNIRIDITLDEFMNLQSAIFSRYEHVWIHWLLGDEKLIVQCLETRAEFEDGFSPYISNGVGSWVMQYHHSSQTNVYADSIMMSMQYAIPLEILTNVLRAINISEFSKRYTGREVELKFLKRSDLSYLGPNSDDDVVLLNTFWPSARGDAHQVFNDFEAIMQGYKAKPHWGKFHSKPSHDYLRNSFSNWHRFNRIRSEIDPLNMFNIFNI